MTRQSTFKKQIRARMAKTGERYSTARLALLRAQATGPTPLHAGYPTDARVLTDLGALAAILEAHGVQDPLTGAPFTETRLFGLSGGPGFMAFLFQYRGVCPMLTFTCRSFSLPGPVVERALTHAGIAHEQHTTGGAKGAAKALDAALAEGPVHLAVDQATLPWLGLDPAWKGQWPRHVNVVGADDDTVQIHDGGLWSLRRDELDAARAGVKKAKHRMLHGFATATADPADATRDALRFYAANMREAPFKGYANNFGLAGLSKTAERMADGRTKDGWGRIFSTGPYAFRALWRTWECVQVELTGPAGGRLLFAEFLDEAAAQPGLGGLHEAASLARRSADGFETLAGRAVEAGGELIEEAIALTEAIDDAARSGDPEQAAGVAALRAARSSLAERCTLDDVARRNAFAGLAAAMDDVAGAETALVRAVEAVVG